MERDRITGWVGLEAEAWRDCRVAIRSVSLDVGE